MQLIPFTSRHSRFADDVDAFVDGELHGQPLRAFQGHLGSCARCAAAVSDARALKASFASLPQRGAPRSFALTPAMASSEPRERLPALVTTPVYLTFARVAAVVSVVAFVAVFTLSVIGGESSTSGQLTSGAAERNSVPQAADAAGSAPLATSSAESTAAYAVGSPTVLLAPATSGGVSGAGAPSSTPAPPSTGAQQTPLVPQPNDASAVPKSTGPGAEALGDASAFEPSAAGAKDGGSSGIPWTILAGCIAGTFVGVLLVAESRRRRS